MQHLTTFHSNPPTRIGFLYYGLWLLLVFFFETYISPWILWVIVRVLVRSFYLICGSFILFLSSGRCVQSSLRTCLEEPVSTHTCVALPCAVLLDSSSSGISAQRSMVHCSWRRPWQAWLPAPTVACARSPALGAGLRMPKALRSLCVCAGTWFISCSLATLERREWILTNPFAFSLWSTQVCFLWGFFFPLQITNPW